MVGFTPESARLDRLDKRELRRLSACLGATPRVIITGYVHAVTNAKVAREVARNRAVAVRSYLRQIGYTGRVVVAKSITLRPAVCEPADGRCAVVEIRIGNGRSGMFDSAATQAAELLTVERVADASAAQGKSTEINAGLQEAKAAHPLTDAVRPTTITEERGSLSKTIDVA